MSSVTGAAAGRTSFQIRLAILGLREREVDHDVEAAQERVVHVLAEVRREDDRAGVALHLLEQVGDLDVGVAVVRVLHLGALAEERVGLVEEEDRVRALGGAEHAVEVLLGLADVLRDHGGEVEAEEVEAEVAREHLAGHRLARAGLAGEQHLEALAPGDGLLVAPLGQDEVAVAQVGRDRVEHLELALGDHDVGPREGRIEPRRELREAGARGAPCAEVEIRRCREDLAAGRCGQAGHVGGVCDLADREPELGGDVVDVLGARVGGPGGAALGEARLGRLDDDRRRLAERDDRLRRRRADERALAPGAQHALDAEVPVGLELVEAVEADAAAFEQSGHAGLAHQLDVHRVVDVDQQKRLPECQREQGGRVRAGDHHGQRAVGGEEGLQLGDRRRAPRVVLGDGDGPQPAVTHRLVEAGAEQIGGQPVRQLEHPVCERELAPRLEQAHRARAPERRGVVEAVESLRRRDPRLRKQAADQPRRRQLPGHVVVEVGVEPAVLRAELRCGAERERGRLEVAQPEQPSGERDPVVQLGARPGGGELDRQVVGDVEAAKRIGRVRVGRGDRLDRGADPRVERLEVQQAGR